MNTGAPEPVEDIAVDAGTVDLAEAGSDQDSPVLVPLEMPSDGVPDVVVDERRLVEAAAAIAAGTGPVAIDAERASGLPLRPARLPRPAAPRRARAPG